jgi:tRNA(Ile)-lysidine synthase
MNPLAHFTGFESNPTVAVALSGGADSMALTLLAHDWSRTQHGSIITLTVNHRLRKESTHEATQVGEWMHALGIEHHILELSVPISHVTSNIQAFARKLRYQALEDWCIAHNIKHLMTAHHADDVEETIAMRLWRGSGIEGLAGIPEIRHTANLRIIRPLLSIRKQQLTEYLEQRGQPWIEDPSNTQDDYDRNMVRKQLAMHPIPTNQVAQFAAHMAIAKQYIDAEVEELLTQILTIYPDGTALLNAQKMMGYSRAHTPTILITALSRLTTHLSGADSPPRHHELERLLSTIMHSNRKSTTLGGLLFERSPKKNESQLWRICREPTRIETKCLESNSIRWDRRFTISFSYMKMTEILTLKPLGADGLAELKAKRVEFPTHLTHAGKVGLLSIWHLDQLVGVPHIGYWNSSMLGGIKDRIECAFNPAVPLHGFIQTYPSHNKPYATTI